LKPLHGLEEFTIVHFASTKLWNRDYLIEDEKAADDIIVGKRTTKNTESSPCLSLFQFPPKKRSLFFIFLLSIRNNKPKYLMELTCRTGVVQLFTSQLKRKRLAPEYMYVGLMKF
jgi:hypothetical protein